MNSPLRGGTGSAKYPDYHHCNQENCPHKSHLGYPSSAYKGPPHCSGRASGCEHPDHFSPEELEQQVRERASDSVILNDKGVPEDMLPKVQSRRRTRTATRTHVKNQPKSAAGLQEYGEIDPYAFATWNPTLNQGFVSRDMPEIPHHMTGLPHHTPEFPHHMPSVLMSTMRDDAPPMTGHVWAQNSQDFPNQGHSNVYVRYERGYVRLPGSQNSQTPPNDHRRSQSYHDEEYEPVPRNQSVPRHPNQGFQPPPTQHHDTRQHAQKEQRGQKSRSDSTGRNSQAFEDLASWPPGTQNPYSESRESGRQPPPVYNEGDKGTRARSRRPTFNNGEGLQIREMRPGSIVNGRIMRGEVSMVSTRPPR